jgi:hypothetical protein
MPLSTHLPLVEKVLGLQLLAANASLSTTSRLLSVSETTARQLRRTISAAAAAGRRPGQAVREAFGGPRQARRPRRDRGRRDGRGRVRWPSPKCTNSTR